MQNLGQRIRQLRKWRGFSQSELETKSGIKREYLSKLENNELKNPTYHTLLKISSALGIPLTSLIEEIDKPLSRGEPVIKVMSSQEKAPGTNATDTPFYAVPVISEDLAAVNPLYLGEQDIVDFALVPRGWLEGDCSQNRYRCLRLGKDDLSMSPLLGPETIVCFDTYQNDPHQLQHRLVVVRGRENLAFVRWLKVDGGYIVAIPENLEAYGLNIFQMDKETPLIGKVVCFLRKTK